MSTEDHDYLNVADESVDTNQAAGEYRVLFCLEIFPYGA